MYGITFETQVDRYCDKVEYMNFVLVYHPLGSFTVYLTTARTAGPHESGDR